MPKISVIMPVYNAEKFLRPAIESILSQTLVDFELIIINDGSDDRSEEIIGQFDDDRIVYLKQENQGVATALNNGIKLAKAAYVARMDADDIALPDRLRRQLEFLESQPDIALCGTWAKLINQDGKVIGEYDYPPAGHSEIKKYAIWHNPFIHPTVMFRKEIIDRVGGYDPGYRLVEDYELWSRIIPEYKTANLPEYLFNYRQNIQGETRRYNWQMRIRAIKIRLRFFLAMFI